MEETGPKRFIDVKGAATHTSANRPWPGRRKGKMKQEGKLSVFEIIFCFQFCLSCLCLWSLWVGWQLKKQQGTWTFLLFILFFFFWNQRLRSGSQATVTLRSTMKAMWQRANTDPWGHCGFLPFSPTSQAIYQQIWGLCFQRISEPDHFLLPTSLGRATILWPPGQSLFHHVFPVPC